MFDHRSRPCHQGGIWNYLSRDSVGLRHHKTSTCYCDRRDSRDRLTELAQPRHPEQKDGAVAKDAQTGSQAGPKAVVQDQNRKIRDRVRSTLPKLTSHENIYNLPNLLTVSRLIAAPVTAWLLVHDHHKYALALFAYAGITDLVDGWIARRWKLQTVAGSVIDPMADKALMIILTITLAVKGAIPVYLATLILGRDATLAIAAIYYRYASLPAPKTILRYWDFSLPSAEVHPTTVSKYNTFLQLILIGSSLALPVVTAGGQYAGIMPLSDAALHQIMQYYQWLVAGTTVWSGLSYAYLKNAVTIIGSNEALKAKQGARGRAIIGVTFGSVVAAAVYLAFTVDEKQSSSESDQERED